MKFNELYNKVIEEDNDSLKEDMPFGFKTDISYRYETDGDTIYLTPFPENLKNWASVAVKEREKVNFSTGNYDDGELQAILKDKDYGNYVVLDPTSFNDFLKDEIRHYRIIEIADTYSDKGGGYKFTEDDLDAYLNSDYSLLKKKYLELGIDLKKKKQKTK